MFVYSHFSNTIKCFYFRTVNMSIFGGITLKHLPIAIFNQQKQKKENSVNYYIWYKFDLYKIPQIFTF